MVVETVNLSPFSYISTNTKCPLFVKYCSCTTYDKCKAFEEIPLNATVDARISAYDLIINYPTLTEVKYSLKA